MSDLGPDADSYMPLGTDATLWAKEFLRVFHDGRVGSIPDEHALIGWFANAIEAGRDAATPRDLTYWKDRAIVAERKLRAVKAYFTNLDVTSDD